MGKFTSVSLNRPTADQSASQLADLVSQQLQGEPSPGSPVAELQQETPQATRVGAVEVTSTPVEAEAVAVPEPTGDPEQLAQIQEMGHLRVDERGQVREATPEETQEDYLEELKQGRRDFRFYDPDSGEIAIPRVGPVASSGGVAKLETDLAKFANAMAGLSNAEAKKKIGEDQAYGAFPHAPADVAPVLQKLGIAEAAGGTKVRPNLQAAGVAYLAFLAAARESKGGATVITQDKQTGEAKEVTSDDEPVQRNSFNRSAADIFQRLVDPSTNVDPTTGAASGPSGYQPANPLTNTEQQALGDFIVNSARAAGLIDTSQGDGSNALMAEKTFKVPGPDGKPIDQTEYFPTEYGVSYLNKLAPVLEEVAPGSARPVSLVPNPGGKAVGAKRTKHVERTRVPLQDGSQITPEMAEALNVLGATPNMVNSDKLAFMQHAFEDTMNKKKKLGEVAAQQINAAARRDAIMQTAQLDANGNPIFSSLSPESKQALGQLRDELEEVKLRIAPEIESPYASMFNQDQKSFMDKVKASIRDNTRVLRFKLKDDKVYMFKGGSWKNVDEHTKIDRSLLPEDGSEYRITVDKRKDNLSHYKFATKVQESAANSTDKTLKDAENYKNKVFYYEGTVIGNSGRIMVSNTELNYQANKLARYLVDNPKPTLFKKGDGSANERGFRYVVARNLVPDADTMTPERLMENFKNMEDTLGVFADQMYAASQIDRPDLRAAEVDKAFAYFKQNGPHNPDKHWKVKEEWGFTLDAIVELGKYRALPQGAQMQTRVKAEGDGINNGSSIQGLQFGTKTILERAGVSYDPESGSVLTNEENMRDYLFKTMRDIDQSNASMSEDEFTSYSELMTTIEENGLKKDLIKIPLMVTIYGKPFDSHSDHLRKFFNENADAVGVSTPEEIKAAIAVIDKGLQAGLMSALNEPLVHQALVKQVAGWLMNAMEVIPEIEGANGYMWQSGTSGSVGITKMNPAAYEVDAEGKRVGDKAVKRQLTAHEFGPTPLGAKDKDGSPGSAARNQLAVNGTHNIDSTIAQETMVQLNKEGKWGHQVFDAFIGDASSFGRVMEIGNDKFVSVNRRYNLLEKELEAYDRAVESFRNRIDNSDQETFDIGGGDLPGIELFLRKRLSEANKVASERNSKNWVKPLSTIKAELGQFGITFDKKGPKFARPLNKAQVKSLFKFFEANYGMPEPGPDGRLTGKTLPTRQIFQKIVNNVNRQRAEFYKNYDLHKPRVRQYN